MPSNMILANRIILSDEVNGKTECNETRKHEDKHQMRAGSTSQLQVGLGVGVPTRTGGRKAPDSVTSFFISLMPYTVLFPWAAAIVITSENCGVTVVWQLF